WPRTDPIPSVVSFAPEPIAAMKALGLRGFWMGYFAGRFAPLGALGPAPVAAMCYSFAPARAARALPEGWRYPSPADRLSARVASAADALRAHVSPALLDSFRELAAVLW